MITRRWTAPLGTHDSLPLLINPSLPMRTPALCTFRAQVAIAFVRSACSTLSCRSWAPNSPSCHSIILWMSVAAGPLASFSEAAVA